VTTCKQMQVESPAMRGSELEFFSFVFGLFGILAVLLILAVVIPVVLAAVVAVMHFRLRADREQVEGIHTVAAYGSRAGAKLGLIAGIVVSGAGMLMSLSTMTGSESLGGLLSLFGLIGVLPSAAWGMLSGSIAGNRSNERTAGLVGGLMFLLMADPAGSLMLISQLVLRPENSFEQFPLLLGPAAGQLLYVVAGAVTGVLAVRIGRERLAEHLRPMAARTVNPWEVDGRI